MAKRYTPNQSEYLKQIRRIRKALSTLRREGFDVSALADKYTKELPKRVTAKLINELKAIKPKDLKSKAIYIGYTPKKHTPLNQTPIDYNIDTVEYLPPSTHVLPNIETALTTSEQQLFEPQKEETYTEELIDYIPNIETEYETYPEDFETTDEEYFTPEDLETTEEDNEEQGIQVIETDTEVLYIDNLTGEIVNRITRLDTQPIDLSEVAIESLRDVVSHFSPQISENLNHIIDKMINEKGKQAVAEAFTQEVNDKPSLLQLLSSPYTKYKALVTLVSDLCEKLELDNMTREVMRDNVTRESMSDMDEYL